MRLGFRVRFVLWFAGLSALLVGCVVAASVFSLRKKLERDLRADVAADCFLLDSMVVEEIEEMGDAALAKADIERNLRVAGYPVRVSIAGRGLVDRATSDLDRLPADQAVLARARAEQGTFWTGPSGEEYLVYVAPFTALEGTVRGEIMTSRPAAPMKAQIRQALLEGVLAWAAALLLCVLLGRFVAGRAMGPVRALTRIAEGLDARNFSKRANLSREEPELARLGEAFNRMLDRLGEAFHRLDAYSADAAHEVQTPLAVMRGNLEVAIREGTWSAGQRELLGSLLEEVEWMQGVCQDLLYLARADAGAEALAPQEVPLAEVVQDVEEIGGLLGSPRGISVHMQKGALSCRVRGDRTRLLRALTNLVDNAVKYGRDGGNVWIWLVCVGDAYRVVVQDDGAGIAAEHLPHVFERFYKVDPARGRSVRSSGLGLAVTRAIVQAHGGTIGIASTQGVGTLVTVTLPAAPPAGREAKGEERGAKGEERKAAPPPSLVTPPRT